MEATISVPTKKEHVKEIVKNKYAITKKEIVTICEKYQCARFSVLLENAHHVYKKPTT